MGFTERTITMQKIKVKKEHDYITIGVNTISLELYEKHKEAFDIIINSGDVAWNEPIHQDELISFIIELEQNKVLLENTLTLEPKRSECQKGEKNMDMKELAKQEEIKNGYDNIPVGMTKLKADSIDVKPVEIEFNGVTKTRYEVTAKTTDGKDVKYGCGVQIYNGLIAVSKQGNIKTIYITRNGTTKDNTNYTVAGE
jgi:hypothetical protein